MLVAITVFFGALSVADRAIAAVGAEQYKYDALGRLAQVTFADGRTIKYLYDAAERRDRAQSRLKTRERAQSQT